METLVLLTGPKHSGKTSAGRALAALRGGGFIDLDELVEEQTGKSPRALYKEGPEVFREAEAAALAGLLGAGPPAAPPLTAAAGGGLIDNGRALALLADPPPGAPRVSIVYLEVPPETAWERIERAAAETGELPPFLNTPRPRETHRALHLRRAAAYRQLAGHTVWAGGKTPAQLAAEIAALTGPPPRGFAENTINRGGFPV